MRRQLTRLLRYSTFGGTRFPYLQRQVLYYLVHETTNCSTTAVLDLRKDMLPISQEDFFSSMRRQLNRLLRYMISGRDMLPIFQENSRMGQTPYLSHETTTYSTTHEITKVSTTTVLDLRRNIFPISQEDFFSSMRKLNRLLRYSISGWDIPP